MYHRELGREYVSDSYVGRSPGTYHVKLSYFHLTLHRQLGMYYRELGREYVSGSYVGSR
jgi:hypothetical protein